MSEELTQHIITALQGPTNKLKKNLQKIIAQISSNNVSTIIETFKVLQHYINAKHMQSSKGSPTKKSVNFDHSTKNALMKMNALYAVKCLMVICSPIVMDFIVAYILPVMTKDALFDAKCDDNSRGLSYFIPKDNGAQKEQLELLESYGYNYVRLCIELIQVGSIIQPYKLYHGQKTSDHSQFLESFNKIHANLFQPPTKYIYFKEDPKNLSSLFDQKTQETTEETLDDYSQIISKEFLALLKTGIYHQQQSNQFSNLDVKQLIIKGNPVISKQIKVVCEQALNQKNSKKSTKLLLNVLDYIDYSLRNGNYEMVILLHNNNIITEMVADTIRIHCGNESKEEFLPDRKGKKEEKSELYDRFLVSLRFWALSHARFCCNKEKQLSKVFKYYYVLENHYKIGFPATQELYQSLSEANRNFKSKVQIAEIMATEYQDELDEEDDEITKLFSRKEYEKEEEMKKNEIKENRKSNTSFDNSEARISGLKQSALNLSSIPKISKENISYRKSEQNGHTMILDMNEPDKQNLVEHQPITLASPVNKYEPKQSSRKSIKVAQLLHHDDCKIQNIDIGSCYEEIDGNSSKKNYKRALKSGNVKINQQRSECISMNISGKVGSVNSMILGNGDLNTKNTHLKNAEEKSENKFVQSIHFRENFEEDGQEDTSGIIVAPQFNPLDCSQYSIFSKKEGSINQQGQKNKMSFHQAINHMEKKNIQMNTKKYHKIFELSQECRSLLRPSSTQNLASNKSIHTSQSNSSLYTNGWRQEFRSSNNFQNKEKERLLKLLEHTKKKHEQDLELFENHRTKTIKEAYKKANTLDKQKMHLSELLKKKDQEIQQLRAQTTKKNSQPQSQHCGNQGYFLKKLAAAKTLNSTSHMKGKWMEKPMEISFVGKFANHIKLKPYFDNCKEQKQRKMLLKHKQLLYKDDNIEIGCIGSRIDCRSYKLTLFLAAETKLCLEGIESASSSKLETLKVELIEKIQFPLVIPKKHQQKMHFEVTVGQTPYILPEFKLNLQCIQQKKQLSVTFLVPCPYHKFLKLEKQDNWPNFSKLEVIRTKEIPYSRKILKNIQNLKDYLPGIEAVNLLEQSYGQKIYGSKVKLDDFVCSLKVTIKKNQFLYIEGGAAEIPQENREKMEFLLATLNYMFMKQLD